MHLNTRYLTGSNMSTYFAIKMRLENSLVLFLLFPFSGRGVIESFSVHLWVSLKIGLLFLVLLVPLLVKLLHFRVHLGRIKF